MAFGTKVSFEPIREINFGAISGTYAAVGTPFPAHVRVLRIVNDLDAQVYISVDGSTNNLRFCANSFLLLDLSANKIRDDGLFLAVGTQIYVKQVGGAPTTGALWIEVVNAIGGV